MLDPSFQDAGLFASVQCAGNLRYRRFASVAANAGGHTGAALVPHLIHNRSGAGSNGLGVDLNGDGEWILLLPPEVELISSGESGQTKAPVKVTKS